MGRKSISGGATPKGNQIQLHFRYAGRRYRPTIPVRPTKSGLDHARVRVRDIARRIELGTFNFAEEFPKYRFLKNVAGVPGQVKFKAVADAFEKSIGEMAHATRVSYKKILKQFWRPKLDTRDFFEIKYTDLAGFIGEHAWGSTKTRNNIVSVGKRVFEFGYADHEGKRNPAEKLKMLRVQRDPPDPYTIDEAEAIIAGIRKDYGSLVADYVEWGFFTGMRPSETIALTWPNVDAAGTRVRVDCARVMGQDKDTTKTSVVRDVELCPRAQAVLRRQEAVSRLAGEEIFLREPGTPWHDLQVQWRAWKAVHKRLKLRHREPYQMRHTSVTWHLMLGKNLLWVARQHGHSTAVMLKTYARWMEGTTEADVEKIRRAYLVDKIVDNPKTVENCGERSTLRVVK